MSGADAAMLYTETASSHMHTLKVAVLDPTPGTEVYDRSRLVEELRRRLHVLPHFRSRVVPVPLGLHHPVWVEDPAFDLERHVHELALPAPGGRAEFDGALSTIHGRPLDRDRPLWEVTLVTGAADGTLAVVAKIHHALADGMAAATLLAHLASDGPDDRIGGTDTWRPDPLPGAGSLLVRALIERIVQLANLPALLRRTVEGARRRRAASRALDDLPPGPLRGPTASFNGALGPERSVATATLRLDDFRAVKTANDCTINDVLLAVTAGSLRRMLERRGEPVVRAMTCAIPVAVDAPGAVRFHGNQVTQLFTSLRTDVDDPIERLRRIHAVTKNAKVLNAEFGPELMGDWNEFASPGPYQVLWRKVMPKVKQASVNIVVSNVPGPREPIWFAGLPVVDFYSASVLTEGVGLNVTVWSYLDHMYVGFTTCPRLLADAHEFTSGVADALAELVDLSGRPGVSGSPA